MNEVKLDSENPIRLLEEVSLTALPALQTAYYDGWVLRFAGGYTRRANSVNPLYLSTRSPNDKIKHCERLYKAYKLPTVFKLTPLAYPSDLDQRLAFHHYKEEAGASVQTCDLMHIEDAIGGRLSLLPKFTEEWLAAYFRLNTTPGRYLPVMRQILSAVVPPTCCGAVYEGRDIVAVGLAVLDQGYLGLFDIVTQADFRRQGLGKQLVSALLNWGRANGAEKAYLQVRPDNDPALSLYETLGFREVYQYWYRTKIT